MPCGKLDQLHMHQARSSPVFQLNQLSLDGELEGTHTISHVSSHRIKGPGNTGPGGYFRWAPASPSLPAVTH